MKPLKIRVVRQIDFVAAHFYRQPQWDEKKNREVFGACFSEFGHGHNYVFEAHFEGDLDPQTGMVLNLADIDCAMDSVTKTLDHKHLNHEVSYFTTHIPTTENIAIYCFQNLSQALGKHDSLLCGVKVYESARLWAEVWA